MKEFGRRILFLSPVPFSGLRQRHQALALGLSSMGAKVTFLNPLQSGGFGIDEVRRRDNPLELTVRVPFKASRHPALQRIACRIARGIIVRAGFWNPAPSLFWIGDPSLAWVIPAIGNAPGGSQPRPEGFIVYDRCDLHGSFPGQRCEAWKRHEEAVFAKSGAVFCSSRELMQGITLPRGGGPHLLPNAANREWVERGRVPGVLPPPGPPFRVISAGAHFEWTDFAWLEWLASNPEIRLTLAGPGRGAGYERLRSNPRVRATGTVSHGSLLEMISKSHIGVIPFLDLPLTRAVDPIKVYEYASMRIPVWSSPVPGPADHPLVTRVLRFGENLSELARSDILYGRWETVPSWDDRVDEALWVIRRAFSLP